jgi:pimeloyl-ACP methyl ester carboxylesterase
VNDGFDRVGVLPVRSRAATDGRSSWLGCATLLLPVLFAVGCTPLQSTSELRSAARWSKGYVIILPGIEGRSYLNENIAFGLNDGGVPGAVEIYDWTVGGSFTWLLNLRWSDHNNKEAAKIADMIKDYQDKFPGRPVCLIGYSGGGGVAVLTLEHLPPERKVDSAILLAPALAPDYDLRRALTRTRSGIWNYYSKYDVGFLQVGTSTFGTIEGKHARAAGAVGFVKPWGMNRAGHELYDRMLKQQEFTPQMADAGHYGLHTTWAKRAFVSRWLAPIVRASYSDAPQYASDTPPAH